MRCAGAPERLEMDDLTVKADFGFGANSSHLLDSGTDGLNIKVYVILWNSYMPMINIKVGHPAEAGEWGRCAGYG